MNYPPVVDPGRDQRGLIQRLERIEKQLIEQTATIRLLLKLLHREVDDHVEH